MTVNTESEVYDAIVEKDISQHRQLELFVDVNFKRSCVNQHENRPLRLVPQIVDMHSFDTVLFPYISISERYIR